MTSLPPEKEWSQDHWLTTKEMAEIYNRSLRRIQQWCGDGTLSTFGFSVFEVNPRKTFIRRPPDANV